VPTRTGSVHVATTKREYKGKVYETHLLRRTYREGGKVKHQTLGNLSHLPASVIDVIRRSLRGETLMAPEAAFEIERSRPHGHVAAVLGTWRRLRIDALIDDKPSRQRDLLSAMVVARILEPRSKLATARALNGETLHSSLGEMLEVATADEDELYESMDWLLPRQNQIEQALAKKHLSEGTLVLYDLTSVYFEGRCCPLAKLGHSRDEKNSKLQIVVGLLTNRDGCPIAIEVFEGNTGDPKTVRAQIAKIRERFGIRRVILVGDRGVLTSARIREDLKPTEGIDWITALRAPSIQQLVESGALQMGLFDEKDLAEIVDPAYPGERLIACKNPILAEERARKREDLLKATEKELEQIAAATRRSKRPLRGASAIGLRVGRVLGRFKMNKHFRIQIQDSSFHHERDQKRIDEESALDGIYVIRTSVPSENLSSSDAVRCYKQLSGVERAFRSMKTVDLKIRPVHHRLEKRVRAHVLLCMLAYYVEWHMRRDLAPILFDDEQPTAKASPVVQAQRSDSAEQKAQSKRTNDRLPAQSFQALLADLATIVKNRIRPRNSDAPAFEMITTPTPLQQRALELLHVRL
jgi:transposase